MHSSRVGHLAPVVIVAHDAGPQGWTPALEEVATALESHPNLPLTLRVPGAALAHVVAEEPELWDRLRHHETCWLAGGWSDPVLADLPLTASRLQLSREKTTMDAAGIEPGGLWLGDGWERLMTSFATEHRYRLVFLDAGLLSAPADRPGPVDRAGDTVIVVPVTSEPGVTDDVDGLSVVRLQAADLGRFCVENRGRLTSPERYLADHLPGKRLSPRVEVPARGDDTEPFYRRLLGVIADQSDRTLATDLVLRLESREFTTGDGGGEPALQKLLEARKAVDRARYRGDSWVRVGEVDWDADGIDEIQVETGAASLVVDTLRGRIAVWDDKEANWPITAVLPAMVGALAHRLGADGIEPATSPMRLDQRTEGRSEVRLSLADGEGGRYRVLLADRSLTVELNPGPSEPVMIGPELPVLLDSSVTRLRVDGGEWLATSEPVAVTGHRFRLTDGERTLLVTAARPCAVFVRPLAGRGLVVWPHWPTTGAAEYQVSFEPT